MRVLYFGTYERDYPRNAQVISCLRRAGVEVSERHVAVWEGAATTGAPEPALRRGSVWPSSSCCAGRRATSTRCSSATRDTSTCLPPGAPREGGR